MEYKTAIVDECGDLIFWAEDLTEEKIDEILENHPEWHLSTVNLWM